jgi:hypothetical protein
MSIRKNEKKNCLGLKCGVSKNNNKNDETRKRMLRNG